MTAYRRDIDGLRTVAVLPVCLAHAGIPGFSGGFIGVDIFFVISGFLITGILVREAEEGRFSLLGFYERRARRILPALFAMLAVALAVGYAILPPVQYQGLAQSTVATVIFASNIWFLRVTGDYFGTEAELEPLLHTWSLAVEEQFYIVFPLIVWLLARRGRGGLLLTVAAITALSFAASVWAMTGARAENFFLAPLRAWELGLGALLALWRAPALGRAMTEGIALGGAGLIAASILLLDGDSAFPGLTALPACLGAAALIWAGAHRRTAVTWLLSTAPFVGIGLISYSLYLWHWPPLVLARLMTGSLELAPATGLALVAFAFVPAVLSWRFIERPFRQSAPTARISRRGVLVMTVVGAGTLAGFAGMVREFDGAIWRFAPEIRATYLAAAERSPVELTCARRDLDDLFCPHGVPSAQPSVLLWGDSHASAFVPGFAHWLTETGQAGYSIAKGACPPLLGLDRPRDEPGHGCAAFNEGVIAFLAARPEIETVVLSARWALVTEGQRYRGEPDVPFLYEFTDDPGTAVQGNPGMFERGLDATLAALRAMDRNVVVLQSIPEMGIDVPMVYLAREFGGLSAGGSAPDRAAFEQRSGRSSAIIRSLTEIHQAGTADFSHLICTPGCGIWLPGGRRLLYRDDDHISSDGAIWLFPAAMKRALAE